MREPRTESVSPEQHCNEEVGEEDPQELGGCKRAETEPCTGRTADTSAMWKGLTVLQTPKDFLSVTQVCPDGGI